MTEEEFKRMTKKRKVFYMGEHEHNNSIEHSIDDKKGEPGQESCSVKFYCLYSDGCLTTRTWRQRIKQQVPGSENYIYEWQVRPVLLANNCSVM